MDAVRVDREVTGGGSESEDFIDPRGKLQLLQLQS